MVSAVAIVGVIAMVAVTEMMRRLITDFTGMMIMAVRNATIITNNIDHFNIFHKGL